MEVRQKCNITFLPLARTQLLNAHDFYENALRGLGVKFEDAVFERINLIASYPYRYPERKAKFRECPIKKFPFLIIYQYKIQQQQILIVSIFDTKQHPKSKYKKS